MKKTILFFGLLMFVLGSVFAQKVQNYVLNPTTSIKGTVESVAPEHRTCGTMDYLQDQINNDPGIAAKMQEMEDYTESWIKNNPNYDPKIAVTIPVVVHIVYSSASYNISDARVQSQIDILNRDFGGLNTNSMGAFSTSLLSNTEVQFCLAQRDPSNNASTGIERRGTAGVDASFTTDNQVKHYAQGGLDAWDPTRFFNVWVCNLGGGLLGYAQFPSSGINSTYGVVILYSAFGANPAFPPYSDGATSTHEVGHCLNLFHIWGDDGTSCSGTDNCADTPNQAGENYTCPAMGAVVTDACSPSSPGVMYMNFMDYSDDVCMTNFTPGQKARMQALFTGNGALVSILTSDGCVPPGGGTAPVAAFTWAPTSPVVNTSAQFTDQSSNTPTSWAWTFGDGGTSVAQNPTYTYATVGTYNACLTATNAFGNNQVCHSIDVSSTPAAGCDTAMAASFTSGTCNLALYYADATPFDSGFVSGQNAYLDKEKAMLCTAVASGLVSDVYVLYGLKAGTSGNTSVKLYSSNAGVPGTLLGTSATISKSAIDTTGFGVNFNNVYHFSTPVSASSDFFASVVLPTTFATGTDELAILCSQYACSSTSPLAYELWSDDTWGSFIDVYGVNIDMAIFPEICITTGGVLVPLYAENVHVFPNPSTNEFNVLFIGDQQKDVVITIYNSVGEYVKTIKHNELTDNIVINMSDQASGLYNVKIQTPEGSTFKKLILMK